MPVILSAMCVVLSLVGSTAIFISTDEQQPFQPGALPILGWPVFLRIVLIPLGVAWMCLELIHFVSPRRLLSPRRPGIACRLMHGIGLAAGWMLAQTLGLWLLGPFVPDWGISAISAVVVTPALGMSRSRCQPGHCIACAYDLRQTRIGDPCPECGGHATRYGPAASHAPAAASSPALSSN